MKRAPCVTSAKVACLQVGRASCSVSLLGPLGTPRVLEILQQCLAPEAVCVRPARGERQLQCHWGRRVSLRCVMTHVFTLGDCPSSFAMTRLSYFYVLPESGLLVVLAPNSGRHPLITGGKV